MPRVDVIHLHHGVWLAKNYPTFAPARRSDPSGPRGYGYHYDPSDRWIMNYMIHNLLPKPTSVKLTYDIDFVPDSSATARADAGPAALDGRVRPARLPRVRRPPGQGKRGKFTFPDQASASQQDDIGGAHEYVASADMTLLATAGHLHRAALHRPARWARASGSCSARRRSTSSRPARCPGTSR